MRFEFRTTGLGLFVPFNRTTVQTPSSVSATLFQSKHASQYSILNTNALSRPNLFPSSPAAHLRGDRSLVPVGCPSLPSHSSCAITARYHGKSHDLTLAALSVALPLCHSATPLRTVTFGCKLVTETGLHTEAQSSVSQPFWSPWNTFLSSRPNWSLVNLVAMSPGGDPLSIFCSVRRDTTLIQRVSAPPYPHKR